MDTRVELEKNEDIRIRNAKLQEMLRQIETACQGIGINTETLRKAGETIASLSDNCEQLQRRLDYANARAEKAADRCAVLSQQKDTLNGDLATKVVKLQCIERDQKNLIASLKLQLDETRSVLDKERRAHRRAMKSRTVETKAKAQSNKQSKTVFSIDNACLL